MIQKQETAVDASHYEIGIVDFTLYIYIYIYIYIYLSLFIFASRVQISRMREDARAIVDCVRRCCS